MKTTVNFYDIEIKRIAFEFDKNGHLHISFYPKNKELKTKEIVIYGKFAREVQ